MVDNYFDDLRLKCLLNDKHQRLEKGARIFATQKSRRFWKSAGCAG